MKENFFVSSGVDKLFLPHMSGENTTIKTPVLLIHGVTYSSHVFDVDFEDYNFASMLSKAGHDVWLVDLPGYAASNHVAHGLDVTIEYAVQALKAAVDFILEKQNSDQIHLFGWSMGTVIASAYALKHPELTYTEKVDSSKSGRGREIAIYGFCVLVHSTGFEPVTPAV